MVKEGRKSRDPCSSYSFCKSVCVDSSSSSPQRSRDRKRGTEGEKGERENAKTPLRPSDDLDKRELLKS